MADSSVESTCKILPPTRGGPALYLEIIRKARWLIIGGTAAAMALALVVSLLLPPVYESSLIIEIGEIFTPQEETIKLESAPIEEPMSVAQVLMSPAFLDATRRALRADLRLKYLADNLMVEQVVETTRFQRLESPLVKLTFEGENPEFNVRILETLAGLLLAEHNREYESSQRMFRARIANLEDRIAASRRLIERQEEYKERIRRSEELVEEGIGDYQKQLEKMDFTESQRTEALFFKSTLNAMKEQIIVLGKEYNEANVAISEAEEMIGKDRDRISNLENLVDLTKNSTVRAAPVAAEEPVRPLVLVNTVVAGVLAAFILVFFAFFRAWFAPGTDRP